MRTQPRMLRLFTVFTSVYLLTLLTTISGEAKEITAKSLYTEALIVERTLRQPGAQVSVGQIRAVIAQYERISHEFPRSAFTDHALWQASGLAGKAFEHYGDPEDLKTALRLLTHLSTTYPVSQFFDRVPARVDRLAALGQTATLTAITHEFVDDVERTTISLNQEVSFRSEYLEHPDRWFVDFIETKLTPEMQHVDTIVAPNPAIVSSIRIGLHPSNTTRVVLDLTNKDDCYSYTLYEPFRIALDCGPSDSGLPKKIGHLGSSDQPLAEYPDSIEATSDPSFTSLDELSDWSNQAANKIVSPEPFLPPEARRRPEENMDGRYSMARQLGVGISRIVIDAGHGGHDPGAVGGDMTEAEVVLDLALRLEQRFVTSRPDLEIVQTRRTDRYLPLDARTTLANRVGADLFLSIHANASENLAIRGIETYYLDFAFDQNAVDLAARENIDGLDRMNHLDRLVSTIALETKLDESRQLANTVQQALIRKLRAVDPELPDLGVKRAPFVVLIGANMPSVLVEVSFLSNEHDATMLSTDAYRDMIVDALFASILQYEHSLGAPTVLAQARNQPVQ